MNLQPPKFSASPSSPHHHRTTLTIGFYLFIASPALAQTRPDILWETPGHNSGVHAVAFSPAGHWLATGSEDSHVRIWSLADGAPGPNTLNCCGVYAVAVSPDDTHVASGSVSALQISRTDDGQFFHRWSPGQSFPSLCYSPDGAWLASGAEAGGVKVWNVQSGSVVRTLTAPGPCRDITFSPDGTKLATTSSNQVLVWNAADWSIANTLTGATGTLESLQFSRDGSRILACDGRPRLWRLSDGMLERTFQTLAGAVQSAALSSDGRTIVGTVPVNSKIVIWRASDGAELRTYDDGTDFLLKIRFSATGRLFAYGRIDGQVITAKNPFWTTGDLDGDGTVGAADMTLFVNAVLGINTNPEQQLCADINEDGAADARDIAPFVSSLIGM